MEVVVNKIKKHWWSIFAFVILLIMINLYATIEQIYFVGVLLNVVRMSYLLLFKNGYKTILKYSDSEMQDNLGKKGQCYVVWFSIVLSCLISFIMPIYNIIRKDIANPK